MTTPIVQSITDEQLAEIDVQRFDCTSGRAQFCYGCYQMSEDAHGDYVSAEDYARLIARLRAAEVLLAGAEERAKILLDSKNEWADRARAYELDAKRYRWLRDKALDGKGVEPCVLMVGTSCAPAFDDAGFGHVSARGGNDLDAVMDIAMENRP